MHVTNKRWNVKMWNGKCDDMRKILSASWSWQEFIEFLSAYSDTLYDKHKIKTSWADERIEDERYGMNNEWQTGQIEVPRGQSSSISTIWLWPNLQVTHSKGVSLSGRFGGLKVWYPKSQNSEFGTSRLRNNGMCLQLILHVDNNVE